MGVHYSAMRDAQLVQARGPRLQLTAVTTGEGNMIQAGAMLVENVTSGLGVGVQAEQLPAAEREHGVVKPPDLLVLVEHRPGGQQLGVPAGAALQISHGHSNMGDRRELSHSRLLIHGGNVCLVTDAVLPRHGDTSVQTPISQHVRRAAAGHPFASRGCGSSDTVLKGQSRCSAAGAGPSVRAGNVSFFVEGDYFEVCNCDVSCNCVWLGTATQDNCDVLLAWHVTNGSKDGVDLSGLNAVMAVHSPKRMTDGGWKVALYLDDRASAEQSQAMGTVFSGGAGGYLAGLAPLIGEVAGVEPAAITFEKSNGSLHAEVSGALSMRSDQLVGMDGQGPAVITNAPFGAVPQPVRQATAKDVSYHGYWSADFTGTNSFVTDFRYEG